MRKGIIVFTTVILLYAVAAYAQISPESNMPYKELIFPQVAAGGQYQTWITVTNRGTQTWNGTLNFYTGQGIAWNPYINGIPLTNGSFAAAIAPKATNTFKVTLPGGTEAGYLVAKTTNINLDNYLEGNLTYFIGNGATILDSVGVMPSRPVLASVIAFEDFSTLCFAFANTDTQRRSTNVLMKLYDNANNQVAQTATIPLTAGAYLAQYLWQTFPTAPQNTWRGRVEIYSDVPVSGMALTQAAGGQLSSLPLTATIRTYSINTTSTEIPFAQLSFWTEGLFINGYGVASGYSDVFTLAGNIASDNTLEMRYNGTSPATYNYAIFGIIKTNETYTPGMASFTGSFYTYVPSASHYTVGTFTATLVP